MALLLFMAGKRNLLKVDAKKDYVFYGLLFIALWPAELLFNLFRGQIVSKNFYSLWKSFDFWIVSAEMKTELNVVNTDEMRIGVDNMRGILRGARLSGRTQLLALFIQIYGQLLSPLSQTFQLEIEPSSKLES